MSFPSQSVTFKIVAQMKLQDGDAPLHIAAWNGNVAMVRYLLGKNADIGITNKV